VFTSAQPASVVSACSLPWSQPQPTLSVTATGPTYPTTLTQGQPVSVAAAAAALQPTASTSAVQSAVSHVNGYTNPDVTCSAVSTSNIINSSDKLHAIAVSVNDKNGISSQMQFNAVSTTIHETTAGNVSAAPLQANPAATAQTKDTVSEKNNSAVPSQANSKTATQNNDISQAPVVVVKQLQTAKAYNGKTPWKNYQKYFERLSVINGWMTKKDKLQHLLLCMEGPAAEVVNEINDTDDTAYDQLWTALSRRFGDIQEERENMHRFDHRKQLPGTQQGFSKAEFEQALKTLHRQAWPHATPAQKD